MTRSVIASERSEARQSHRGLYEIATGLRPRNDRMGGFAIFLTLLLAPHSLLSAASGAAFLKISPSARATSLAGAYTAFADDSSSVFYNPAGLARLSKREFSLGYARWITGMNYNAASFAFPMKRQALGFGFIYLNTGGVERRGPNREILGRFSSYDMASVLSYSRVMYERRKEGKYWGSKIIHHKWSLGVSAKLIRQSIDNSSALGMAFDVGQTFSILRPSHKDEISIGLSLLNIGPKMRFASESFNLPASVSLGLGYRFYNVISLGADVKRGLFEKRTEASFGAEISPMSMFSLRAGYLARLVSALSRDRNLGELQGLSGGIGFRFLSHQLDYAFSPMGLLGNTHRLSFSARF